MDWPIVGDYSEFSEDRTNVAAELDRIAIAFPSLQIQEPSKIELRDRMFVPGHRDKGRQKRYSQRGKYLWRSKTIQLFRGNGFLPGPLTIGGLIVILIPIRRL